MNQSIAVEALEKGVCLQLSYHGYSRLVEVHAVGINKKNQQVMRVWQVSGGSESNDTSGWKLMVLADAQFPQLTTQKSLAPRPGYKKGDSFMTVIASQL